MKIGILGAGLSGVSIAYFLQQNNKVSSIEILDKESDIGGLCRSFDFHGVYYDIGPHIIFSKDQEILNLMINMLGDNVDKIRRSNKIYHKDKFIKYPLENELSALPDDDKNYCLNTFLNNPYETCVPENLHQFFLRTFGKGITDIFLKPYNEKIWKYDLSLMDIRMADRIPQPPKEDVIKGASGESTEGYLHQLYFHYPKRRGINSLINSFTDQFNDKVRVESNSTVVKMQKLGHKWIIKTDKIKTGEYDVIISTIPIQSLANIYKSNMPEEVIVAVDDLKYNSIIISIMNVKRDNLGKIFAVMVPDKEIIFHRVSKLNFHGDNYCPRDGSSTLMAEITYSKGSSIDKMSNQDVEKKIIEGLRKLKFIDNARHVNFMEIKRFEYAYVICDLNHQNNMNVIRNYFSGQGIRLCGRFGEFEYLNMDAVIRHAKNLSEEIGKNI